MACLRGKFQGGVILNGRYETLSPLNHGSFGMVFKAHDIKTDNIVAIKCLTKLSAAADVNADFAVDDKSEELALHSRLASHPNIVNFVETFETEAHTYLVLEFCPQGDLYEAIRNGHGPLETEHVRQFMYELVDAVEYIHSKGVFHRDIKPENIFLLQDGSMKLGDFGLATTDEWSHEMSVGSDRYMAPEQFDSEGAGYAPAKADIWAIGICLLNILFSRNPFTTPTASDPLFLDFSRDKESLFDVFPSMSLDTYEVIEQCMNMDPKKRSLEGVREALIRVVTFTTEDEVLDEFCAEKATIASANREPLRTPSIQSPAVDTGSFPWAKALNAMPGRCHGRQLSVIPDDESYTEDLFPASEDSHTDWCSASVQTNSVPASSLGASMHSLTITQRPNARPSPVAESLPISMAQPMKPSLSTIFGRRNDGMSKSWSDMWEEEEEEEEEARAQQLNSLKAMNSRTWSHEAEVEAEPKKTVHPEHITGDVDDDLVADGFFFHEPLPPQPPSSTPRYSPPSKRSNMDKWAALGERRRQRSETSEFETSPDTQSRRFFALDSSKSYEAGVWDYSNFLHHKNNNNNNHTIIHFHNKQPNWARDVKDRSKECPWNKGRESWRRDRRHDFGDVEWVGGW